MKKGILILISIGLHIAVLSIYPAIDLRDRKPHAENMRVTYLGVVSDEDFSIDKKGGAIRKIISSPPRFPRIENEKRVWEVPGLSVDIEWEFFSEPVIGEKEVNLFLKDGGKGPVLDEIMEACEKETPPLIEEPEAENGK